MRIATINDRGTQNVVLERDGEFYAWKDVMSCDPPASALDVLEGLCDGSFPSPVFDGAKSIDGPVSLLPPFLPPRNVICVGKNYAEHVSEFDAFSGQKSTASVEPIIFTKSPSSICGPTDEILIHEEMAAMLDYEVELAVIIGRAGHRISAQDAMTHIAGYSVINDVTERERQSRHDQWFLAKSLRASSPFGPLLVSPDELPVEARLTTHVDGELRQSDHLGNLIFGVPKIIEFVSSFIELLPGDVIATGTPSGVGIGFNPPRCIQDGSTVVCAIDGIGELSNRFQFRSSTALKSSTPDTATTVA